MMMFMMPIMLAFFVFTYTAAFAVYMVSNSFLSILSSIAMTPIINKSAQKRSTPTSSRANLPIQEIKRRNKC